MLRLRTLDGEPVLLERTVYAGWVADAVEALPADCESVTQALLDPADWSSPMASITSTRSPPAPWTPGNCGSRRGSPLLRVRRTTTTAEGRPVETSDDRYRPGSVVFTVATHPGQPAGPHDGRPAD